MSLISQCINNISNLIFYVNTFLHYFFVFLTHVCTLFYTTFFRDVYKLMLYKAFCFFFILSTYFYLTPFRKLPV